MRVHWEDPQATHKVSTAIAALVAEHNVDNKPVTVLCIGTDRSIGDSLGPLVGWRLARTGPGPFLVRGTLKDLVHAGNLEQVADEMKSMAEPHIVIAVDACLGRAESIGMITVEPGPMRPGSGVNKQLPKVGDLRVTGVVNVGGFMEYFVLQNTRMSLVMAMAEVIADGIGEGLTAAVHLEQVAAASMQGG